MKRIFSFILAVWVAVFAALMSGCSDFGFNPLGKWYIALDEVYADGKVITSIESEKMIYKSYYVFEKTGTGYILVEDLRTFDFVYDYTDETVNVTTLAKAENSMTQENFMEYKVAEDGKSMVCVISDIVISNEEEIKAAGGATNIKEQLTLKRV